MCVAFSLVMCQEGDRALIPQSMESQDRIQRDTGQTLADPETLSPTVFSVETLPSQKLRAHASRWRFLLQGT